MRNFIVAGVALLAMGLGFAPASAGTITETYSFLLSGFVDINGSPPLPTPVSAITGSFTVTFDPTLNYDNDTTDLVVHSFSGIGVPLDSQLGFTYDSSGSYFFLGGIENDADFVETGTNDFVLTYNLTDPSAPKFVPCSTPGFLCGANTGNSAYDTSGFTTAGNNSLWFIAAKQSNPNVPEASTWAMMLAGFAGLGFAAFRRSRQRGAASPFA